jgi:ornithine cyclodeaminase/alanine dehydrogenase-like protein (mu-crystallin family)
MQVIDGATVDRLVDWPLIVAALKAGHGKPKPQIGDVYFSDAGNGLLSRSAWISGLGSCVKAATIFPHNTQRTPYMATIQGSVLLFDSETGATRAVVDGAAVTRWKTAGDSALGSQLLSRADAKELLMVGAGTQAEPLIRAHLSVRPSLERIVIWNRTRDRAEDLASRLTALGRPVAVSEDLEAAVGKADIVSVATLSSEPVVHGAWLKSGAHLDLVGAYTPQMRETDDDAMRRSRVFVDFRDTTISHIGELMSPIRDGVIGEKDILGDLYDLVAGGVGRLSAAEITLFKNGGGAHLDLMTTLAIVEAARAVRA